MSGWTKGHSKALKRKRIDCVVCYKKFTPRSFVNKFCSAVCKGKWQYITGTNSTENQYKGISGNWRRYFARLTCRSQKRELITIEDLLNLYEKQGGRCALSGADLTCTLEKGVKCHTNASIDRKIPGKPYTLDNIQLVCAVLNCFRRDTEEGEFIKWCKLVAEHNK